MKALLYLSILVTISSSCLEACKKIISVGTPLNQLTSDKVFSDSGSAVAVMLNTYSLFDRLIDPNLNRNVGMYADEFFNANNIADQFFLSKLSPSNANNQNIWAGNYAIIYQCNDLIEQLKNSKSFSISLKLSLTNEAKFLRAYAYFYLVNLYGAVPLITKTNVNQNATLSKSDSATIYQQILNDLKDAQSELAPKYRGNGKVRANYWAATALLARVALYQNDWAGAERYSTAVIESGLYTPLEPPEKVFLANSTETILSFWNQFGAIGDGPSLIPASGRPNFPLTNTLIDSFEVGDLRKQLWTSVVTETVNGIPETFYQDSKYKNRVTNVDAPEFLIALRISEQYLIRAEARSNLGNMNGAAEDLDIIRVRAGLPNTTASNKSDMLRAILHERQVELFAEWGHRFLDLKREGLLNTVLGPYKPSWTVSSTNFPIPQNEITKDPNLVQNTGY